jgi:hypothetical protein
METQRVTLLAIFLQPGFHSNPSVPYSNFRSSNSQGQARDFKFQPPSGALYLAKQWLSAGSLFTEPFRIK